MMFLYWVDKKDLSTLKQTHLGLDLINANSQILENLSKDVLEYIDLEKLEGYCNFYSKLYRRLSF